MLMMSFLEFVRTALIRRVGGGIFFAFVDFLFILSSRDNTYREGVDCVTESGARKEKILQSNA